MLNLKRALRMVSCALALAGVFSLAGCGSSPLLHVGNAIANLGQDLPAEMLDRNLAGMVAFDEDFVGRYNRMSRNVLYVEGIVEGTPEYLYRVARINIQHSDGNLVWSKGAYTFQTGALIPDSLPPLKAGDIVEFRQTTTWRAMEKFSETGEGNLVLKVLCAKADPEYLKCVDGTPKIGTFKGQGPTGTSYPVSAHSLGLSVTPRYLPDGRTTRP